MLGQGLAAPGPGHTDDQGEAAPSAGFNAGLGVLDHDRTVGADAEALGGFEEQGGIGFARQPEPIGDDTVDPYGEAVDDVSSTEHVSRVPAGGHRGDGDAGLGSRSIRPTVSGKA